MELRVIMTNRIWIAKDLDHFVSVDPLNDQVQIGGIIYILLTPDRFVALWNYYRAIVDEVTLEEIRLLGRLVVTLQTCGLWNSWKDLINDK